MTNKKTLKRAFILNVLSTLLCISMLLGTTFAWFTDTVESGVNQIVAGNLDVELYHSATGIPTGADAEKVTGETGTLFNMTKWEPGAVVYENFLVKNLGDLALKYKLSLNIADYNSVTDATGTYDLRSALKVAIVPGGFTGDRAAAEALTNYSTLADFEKIGTLLATNDADTYGVVIYWEPTDNDNLYNINNAKIVNDSVKGVTKDQANNRLFISFGVNLVATQYTKESDSFDNTYDESVAITFVPTTGAATFTVKPTLSTDDDKTTTVEFKEESLESGKIITLTVDTYNIEEASAGNFTISQGTNNAAVGAIDLNLKDNDGNALFNDHDGNGLAIIKTFTALNLENVVISYGGNAFDSVDSEEAVDAAGKYFYDSTTGLLVFATNHFSTYVVDSTSIAYIKESNTAYDTLYDAIDAIGAEKTTILMLNNVVNEANKNYEVSNTKSIVLDLNGKTISTLAPDESAAYTIINKGSLVIMDNSDIDKNGSGTGKITSSAINPDMQDVPGYASNTITNHGNLTIESGLIENKGSGYACFAIDNVTNGTLYTPVLTINGGKMLQESQYHYAVRMFCNSTTDINKTVINGGIIEGGYAFWLQTPNNNANKAELIINGGEFIAHDGYAVYFGGSGSTLEGRNYSNTSIVFNNGILNRVMVGGVSSAERAPATFIINGGRITELALGDIISPTITGGTFNSSVISTWGYVYIDNDDVYMENQDGSKGEKYDSPFDKQSYWEAQGYTFEYDSYYKDYTVKYESSINEIIGEYLDDNYQIVSNGNGTSSVVHK